MQRRGSRTNGATNALVASSLRRSEGGEPALTLVDDYVARTPRSRDQFVDELTEAIGNVRAVMEPVAVQA